MMKEIKIVVESIKFQTKYLEMNPSCVKKSTAVAMRLLDDTP
jgi:hypothetical protein